MKFLIPSLLLAFANNVANAEGDHTPMNQLLQEQLESLVPKIVDGVEVNPKFKYPYMVYAGGCGASLVAPNVLLSAAHCFNAINSVQIGRHNLLDNSENYESFSIVEKVRHPNYDSGTLDYDFMMLRMSGSSSRTPVVLDDGSVSLDAGRDVIPIGWGTTSSGGATSNVLLEVEVDLYSKAQCQSAYGASSITDRMVCAARPGKDSCQGDSGGPMIDKVSGKQVGVVSWGFGCALSQYPGVYSKVQNQIDWIEQYIDLWSDGPSPPTSNPPSPPTSSPPTSSPPTSSPPTSSPPSPPTDGECTDYDGWTDNYGDDCTWYETYDDEGCPNYGDLWANPNTNITPREACCYCGGGNNADSNPDPPSAAPTSPPTTGSECSSINRKGKCNRTEGCGYNVFQQSCLDALSTTECQRWNRKKQRCRKNGCKWDKTTKFCNGRWD